MTPSRSSDPRCEAKITLRRSLATDLVDDAVVGTAVAPANILPIFPRNDIPSRCTNRGLACSPTVQFGT